MRRGEGEREGEGEGKKKKKGEEEKMWKVQKRENVSGVYRLLRPAPVCAPDEVLILLLCRSVFLKTLNPVLKKHHCSATATDAGNRAGWRRACHALLRPQAAYYIPSPSFSPLAALPSPFHLLVPRQLSSRFSLLSALLRSRSRWRSGGGEAQRRRGWWNQQCSVAEDCLRIGFTICDAPE